MLDPYRSTVRMDLDYLCSVASWGMYVCIPSITHFFSFRFVVSQVLFVHIPSSQIKLVYRLTSINTSPSQSDIVNQGAGAGVCCRDEPFFPFELCKGCHYDLFN